MQRCQHDKFGNCPTRSLFSKNKDLHVSSPKYFCNQQTHFLFSHKSKLHTTNTNREFGATVLWTIMQWCRRGIIYKLPNSLQKELRSMHFWPKNCHELWHFCICSKVKKNKLLELFKPRGCFYGFWGVCFPLSLFFVVLKKFWRWFCLSENHFGTKELYIWLSCATFNSIVSHPLNFTSWTIATIFLILWHIPWYTC